MKLNDNKKRRIIIAKNSEKVTQYVLPPLAKNSRSLNKINRSPRENQNSDLTNRKVFFSHRVPDKSLSLVRSMDLAVSTNSQINKKKTALGYLTDVSEYVHEKFHTFFYHYFFTYKYN